MIYFTSDVHLGLKVNNPQEREQRFISWLRSIAWSGDDTLVLLGDIWDFWYEYKYVIPKEGIKVVAAFVDIMDKGAKIIYFPGNHDIWCFHFFEEIGIEVVKKQPVLMEFGGKRLVLAHGDGVGGAKWSYSLMLKIFHSRFCQALFSTLHPRLAFALARRWSKDNRYTHTPYEWKGEQERLWKYALNCGMEADYFIFGHYHCPVDELLPGGARLIVLDDWIKGGCPFFSLEP